MSMYAPFSIFVFLSSPPSRIPSQRDFFLYFGGLALPSGQVLLSAWPGKRGPSLLLFLSSGVVVVCCLFP